jgi:SAM-dependent methyltransferase
MGDSAAFYNTIARYYDAENEFMVDDLPMYSTLAEEYGGPILDVGCGTGRVAFHLAAEGHAVDGIDFAEAMLARGERKLKGRADVRERVRLFRGNAANYAFPRKYNLILLVYNCLLQLTTQAEQIALLKHLRGFLAPNGVMVLDLPNAGEAYAGVDDGAVTLERSFVEPESGNLVMQQSVSTLNRAAQTQDIRWIYDEIMPDGVLKRTMAPLTLRYVFPAEFDLMAQLLGLRVLERYGDYEGSPFEEGSERLVVIVGLGG